MALAKLADETLSKILVHLPHEDLLMAQRVCKKWCKVVSSDPHILEQLFKKRVGKYMPPMSLSRTMESVIALKRKDPVLRMHPAISRISYSLGGKLEDAGFSTADGFTRLKSLPIAQDYLTIPYISFATISGTGVRDGKADLCTLTPVKGTKGLRLLDLFSALAKSTQGMSPEGHVFFEGLADLKFASGKLRFKLLLGS